MAKKGDIANMARVTARAFCEQDELLVFLKSRTGRQFSPFLHLVESCFEMISEQEVAAQLRKRVGSNKRAAHVVLLAEQADTGEFHFPRFI